jgi:putative aldouronate transport system permease protein
MMEKLKKRMDYKKYVELYLFLLIPLLWLLLFCYGPMYGIQLAFKKFSIRQGIWGSPWVGLTYFKKFFTSYQFFRVLPNTLRLSLYSLLAGFPIPVVFALLLNAVRAKGFKKSIQMITYIPFFISTVVLVGMLFQIFNPQIGFYGIFYTKIFGTMAPDLMANPDVFPHLYVWSGIWQGMGFSSIIYVAALANVDTEQHEAALIDGATRLQRIMYIDFPALLPTITIMLILAAGGILGVAFEKVYLMQLNLNLRSSEVIATYVYKVGLAQGSGDFSYATAIGLFNSLVSLILLVTVNQIAKKISESSLF